ncbi:hypothetical protein LZ554_006355 [Drepanopeziza brunnea f. sp. 'monogermtubi']|nr:hypothetical protein LZ554_006355 [Drepanopeziza brunnea f. sp. 'monogermtubi']
MAFLLLRSSRFFHPSLQSSQNKLALAITTSSINNSSTAAEYKQEESAPTTPYRRIFALMFSWEHTDVRGTHNEMCELADVLRTHYRPCHIRGVQIPARNPFVFVENTLHDFKRAYSDPDHLLVVYYAGHGSRSAPGERAHVACLQVR